MHDTCKHVQVEYHGDESDGESRLTSIKPNDQRFGQGVMDSLIEPVEEGSTSNMVNSDIAGVLLKRDLGLSRKCCYPISFFFFSSPYSIHSMTSGIHHGNEQERQ